MKSPYKEILWFMGIFTISTVIFPFYLLYLFKMFKWLGL